MVDFMAVVGREWITPSDPFIAEDLHSAATGLDLLVDIGEAVSICLVLFASWSYLCSINLMSLVLRGSITFLGDNHRPNINSLDWTMSRMPSSLR